MNGPLLDALRRFGVSIVESGIVFASIATYSAVTADPNVNYKVLAGIAAAAFIKGVIDAAGKYLNTIKEQRATA